MKLAEALAARADTRKRMASLVKRMQRNPKIQEGEESPERVAVLLADYERESAELERLIPAINRTNAATALPDAGMLTMTDALARQDVLNGRITTYWAVGTATPESSRSSRTEIRSVSQISANELQRTADRLSGEHRRLDNAIQAANWTIELIDPTEDGTAS